jgi:hypothetical protein
MTEALEFLKIYHFDCLNDREEQQRRWLQIGAHLQCRLDWSIAFSSRLQITGAQVN